MFYNLLKTAVMLLAIDTVYLLTGGIFARRMFERIQARELDFRYMAAIPVYLAMAYMLLQTTSYTQAALYGLCIYTVFDMTNYAIFSAYDIKIAVMDMIWGALLFVFARYLLKNVF